MPRFNDVEFAFQRRNRERAAKKQEETPADKAARITAVPTKWLAAFTCALAIANVGTYFILKNQLIDARKATRLDQRAWVGVDKVNSFNFKVGPNFSIPFDMVNTGKTPALHVATRTSMKSLEKGDEFSPTYSDPRPIKPSIGVIQPQMHLGLSTLPTDIPTAQYGDIENGKGILYAYGDITYDDIFGDSHETTFCVMNWTGLTGPIQCDGYNSAT